jgi:RHS repeat-associated protein
VKKVTGGVTTVFVYNVAGQLIAEYDDLTSPPPGSGGTSYLTTDHLGSTRVVTGQNQVVKARHDYLPFGEEVAANIAGRTSGTGYSANDSTRQKFIQKERDTESGLDYFLARYYSAAIGRFTSADDIFADQRIVRPQSWNLYIYSRNNPLLYIDPSGRTSFASILDTLTDVATGFARGYTASVAGPFAPESALPNANDSTVSLIGQVLGTIKAASDGINLIEAGGAIEVGVCLVIAECNHSRFKCRVRAGRDDPG